MKIDPTLSGDLGWQALHYVAHSLSDEQRAVFELRLLDDQRAREAVAQAVDLAHTVAVLHSGSICLSDPLAPNVSGGSSTANVINQVAVNHGHGWNSRLAWFGVGIAACLAVMLAWQNSWNVSLSQPTLAQPTLAQPSPLQSSSDLDRRPLEPTREHLSLAWANMNSPAAASLVPPDSVRSAAPSLNEANQQPDTNSEIDAADSSMADPSIADAAALDDSNNIVLEWIVTGLQDIDSDDAAPINQGKLPAREM